MGLREESPRGSLRAGGHTSPEGPSCPLRVPVSPFVLLIDCCVTSELSGFARPVSVTSGSMWVWDAGVAWLATRLRARQPPTRV